MTGWIKIHRKIIEHWIWEDAKRFKWWMDILLLTNHTDKKTMIGGELITIKRGTFHTSELKLSERWNVSRNTVRNYLNALEKNNMINTKKTRNGTTIEVRNYGIYQGNEENIKQRTEQQTEQRTEQRTEQQTEQRTEQRTEQYTEQKKDNRLNNTLNTTKNVKNIKNDKNVKKEKKKINVFVFFQENGFGQLSPYIQQDLNYYLDQFSNDSDDIIIAALKIAKDRNKVSWGYAKSVLNSWLNLNLQSLEQVRAYEIQQLNLKRQEQTPSFKIASKEKTPIWLEQQNSPTPPVDATPQNDEQFERDRQAFQDHLKTKWADVDDE